LRAGPPVHGFFAVPTSPGQGETGEQDMSGFIYRGKREPKGCVVTVAPKDDSENAEPLPRRLDLFNHSPSGFEWGYGGSGPAQLALALLAHHLGDGERAVRLHQVFKFRVVGDLSQDGWELSTEDLQLAVDIIAKDMPEAASADDEQGDAVVINIDTGRAGDSRKPGCNYCQGLLAACPACHDTPSASTSQIEIDCMGQGCGEDECHSCRSARGMAARGEF